MSYAYLDEDNILHITNYYRVALDCAKNKYFLKTDFPSLYGYPIDNDNKIMVLYSATKERKNKPIPKELSDLYKQLNAQEVNKK